jgi:hypothetical protein
MEAVIRTPYQGVWNIIRFNWHFYAVAIAASVVLLLASAWLDRTLSLTSAAIAVVIILSTFLSLFVSHYIYDRSELYNFIWLKTVSGKTPETIANIHAGFDETSSILRIHFPKATLRVFDFYDAEKHTEISIERARKAYRPWDGTLKITTDDLPLAANSTDLIVNIFALHEVRDSGERAGFLELQAAALSAEGRCIVVEHLRDTVNFLAYNVGFIHFLSAISWRANFSQAGLVLEKEFKVTPFISVFILKKSNGTTP